MVIKPLKGLGDDPTNMDLEDRDRFGGVNSV